MPRKVQRQSSLCHASVPRQPQLCSVVTIDWVIVSIIIHVLIAHTTSSSGLPGVRLIGFTRLGDFSHSAEVSGQRLLRWPRRRPPGLLAAYQSVRIYVLWLLQVTTAARTSEREATHMMRRCRMI